MAKRFTDTGKWDDPWFLELKSDYKLFWLFILDRCDISGGWKVNKRMAEFCLGAPVDFDGFLAVCGDRIKVLKNGDIWFVNKFINFQYGDLTETNKIYRSVVLSLCSNGLNKGHLSPINGGKDKDKEKEKDIKGVLGEKKGDRKRWSDPPKEFRELAKKLARQKAV